jgi:hypothetical protein
MRVVLLVLTLLQAALADPRKVLSKIYTSTQGSSWVNNEFWMSEEHHCTWFGVECRDGVVVKLELPQNNLHGPLPKEVGYLTDIEVMNVKTNRISGSIPKQLTNLKSVDLNLEQNLICGDLSYGIANEALFQEWKIVKKNPLLFSDCATVQQVQRNRKLSDCTTGATDTVVIEALHAMYSSMNGADWTSNDNWLDGCPCTDSQEWFGITCSSNDVVGIDLSKNNLVGTIPAVISHLGSDLSNVMDLDLCCNYLTGSLPETMGSLADLESLNLGNNMLCGDVDKSIPVDNELPIDDDVEDYCLDNHFLVDKHFEVGGNSIGTWCPTETPSSAPTTSLAPTPFDCGMGGVGADALCPFYISTQGSDWTSKENWYVRRPCTNSWEGVICENVGQSDAKVIGIKLTENNLRGYINTEMGLLTDMSQTFNLQSNLIQSTIPSELGSYTGLTQMFGLGANRLTGAVPSELGLLASLTRYFHLYDNRLSDEIPSELGLLTQMIENFALMENQFDGAIPSELGELTQITKGFMLSNNELRQAIPTELARLTELTSRFLLQSNRLNGCIPSEFGQFTKMETGFDLKDNRLECSIPSTFGLMTNMQEYFFLHSNRLTGSVPSEFGMWTNTNFHDAASAFNLKNNDLCGDIPDEVTALSNLNLPTTYVTERWGVKSTGGCRDEDSCAAWEIVLDNSIGTPC